MCNMNRLLYDRTMNFAQITGAVIAATMLILLPARQAQAAELIMVEQLGCEWCKVWDEEIGASYHLTAEGKIAPLRRINIHDDLPDDLEFVRGLVFTPTFVLVHDGREIGRILGYPGEDFFWGLLQQLIVKLPEKTDAKFRAEPLRPEGPLDTTAPDLRG